MKALVVTAGVVLLAVVSGAQTQPGETHTTEPPNVFWNHIYYNITANICGDRVGLCLAIGGHCLGELKSANVDTDEDVSDMKVKLTECASEVSATEADFSTLTLENIKTAPTKDGEFDIAMFMSQYGVARHQVGPIVECQLDKNGQLAILRTCLIASISESA